MSETTSNKIPAVRIYLKENNLSQYFENARIGIDPQNNYIVECQDINEKWIFPVASIQSAHVFMIEP